MVGVYCISGLPVLDNLKPGASETGPPPSENMKRNLIIFAILTATILIVYSNSLLCPFHYDDSVNIIRNKNIHMTEFNWESVKASWFAGGARGDIYHPILYRPVAMFSFALNHYFHGLEVLGYHVVNVIVHIITALFLFLFIMQVLTLPKLKEKYGEYAWQIAGIAALLWAINPVQLTNVTYIVQRQNALCGMFYIAGLYFYIKARKRYSLHQYIFSGVAIVLAMGSKENAILAFPAIALLELMFFGITRKKLYVFGGFIVAGFLLTLAVQGWETFTFSQLQTGFAKRDFTMGERLLTESRAIVFYIMILLIPYHGALSLTHVIPVSRGLFDPPETLIALSIIGIILLLTALKTKKQPLIAFCVYFFFLNHLVEGTIIPLELIYEHRNYIPSFFFFLPVAIVIIHLSRRYLKQAVIVATAMLVLFFGFNTYVQNAAWQTDLRLWADVCKKSPDPRSVFNYAGAMWRLGYHKQALKYWYVATYFNKYFGTEYSTNSKIIPYGRVMQMANHNAFMLDQMQKGKFRPGWAVTTRFPEPGDVTDG